jgi:hypothetical protein
MAERVRECFCGTVKFAVSGDPEAMGSATAHRAAFGLPAQSMPFRFGSPMR